MPTAEELSDQYRVAREQGRGTDMTRIKKQLGALGAEPPADPAKQQAKAEAANSRAEVADGEPAAKSSPPRGRTSPRGRQQQS